MSTFERRRPQRLPELLLLTPAHSCAVLVLATLPPPFMSHTSDGVSVRVPPPFMSHTSDASAGIKQSHTDSAACGSSLNLFPTPTNQQQHGRKSGSSVPFVHEVVSNRIAPFRFSACTGTIPRIPENLIPNIPKNQDTQILPQSKKQQTRL